MKAGEIVDSLQQELKRALGTLVAGNVTGIATELIHADDGTLTVGFSLKLNLSGKRVAGTGALSYSRKFKDEIEFITPDPDQPDLPGVHEGSDADGEPLTGSLKKAVSAIDTALEKGASALDVKRAILTVQKSKGGAV